MGLPADQECTRTRRTPATGEARAKTRRRRDFCLSGSVCGRDSLKTTRAWSRLGACAKRSPHAKWTLAVIPHDEMRMYALRSTGRHTRPTHPADTRPPSSDVKRARGAIAVSRGDEPSLSFRFVTGPTIGGHLIPNSDCTPPGYHERGPSSRRASISGARRRAPKPRVRYQLVTLEQVPMNFVLASKDTIKSVAVLVEERRSEEERGVA